MTDEKKLKILAIESSCDETAAAVISDEDGIPFVESNIISSQVDLHAKTGGIVPEVASRAHLEAIIPVLNTALADASCPLEEISHIAVTVGPGLIGSLLVGFNTAKALAYALDIPIIPVNHIEGHIYSALAGQFSIFNFQFSKKSQQSISKKPETCNWKPENFPILALTVSGGHTSLTLMKDHGVYENIGSTLDDAAGEAFDKVAKLLDLGYPGGPAVSKLAQNFRNRKSGPAVECDPTTAEWNDNRKTEAPKNIEIRFPRPLLDQDNYNFSFSGLKTAVLYCVQKLTVDGYQLTAKDKEQICYEFEEAVVDVLVGKTLKACGKYSPKAVILAGGVAANSRLRENLTEKLKNKKTEAQLNCHPELDSGSHRRVSGNTREDSLDQLQNDIHLLIPPIELCGDNAVMIGTAAYYHIVRGDTKRWNEIKVDSNMKL